MNIVDIAKMAGVSISCVSRYFNNGYVSDEKREAIKKVIENTGYCPSVQAQMLRTKKTKMIGIIAPKMASSSISSIVEGIIAGFDQSGYQTILSITQNDYKKEIDYLKIFNSKRVDGIIFIATVFTNKHKKALKEVDVPIVIIGQKLSGYYCVYNDDYHAIYELTKKVISKYKSVNPAYIGVIMQDKAAGESRYRGYKDALKDMNIKFKEDNFVIRFI